MTSDVRELLRLAAETGSPDFGGARSAMQRGRWLRRRRVVQIALPLALAVALVVALTGRELPIIGDGDRIAPTGPGQNEPRRPPIRVEPSTPDRESNPATVTDPRGRPDRSMVTALPAPKADCSPLITDDQGDARQTSIDILRSSITYERDTNSLVFEHTLKDLERGASGVGEMGFELWFMWDDLSYVAYAWVDQAGQEQYSVQRARRGEPATPPGGHWVDLSATGRMDTSREIVRVRVQLDEFNKDEKAASSSEGFPPPKELKAASKLTQIRLETWIGSFGSGGQDLAESDCDYVVGR